MYLRRLYINALQNLLKSPKISVAVRSALIAAYNGLGAGEAFFSLDMARRVLFAGQRPRVGLDCDQQLAHRGMSLSLLCCR